MELNDIKIGSRWADNELREYTQFHIWTVTDIVPSDKNPVKGENGAESSLESFLKHYTLMDEPKEEKTSEFIAGRVIKSNNRRITVGVIRDIAKDELVYIIRAKRLVDYKTREINCHEMVLTHTSFNHLGCMFDKIKKDIKFIEATTKQYVWTKIDEDNLEEDMDKFFGKKPDANEQ